VSPATETEGSPHIDRESLKPLVRPVTASNERRADELSTIDGGGEVDIATVRSDGTTAAWYRGVQTCYEGELSAGRLRLSRQVRRSSAPSSASPQTSPARRPLHVDPA
jgi:hypothetical protein